MNKNHQLLVSALVTGTVASIVSSASLAALAKIEGKSAAQPTNSTSHWLHGDSAAEFKGLIYGIPVWAPSHINLLHCSGHYPLKRG
jgi:hypothetical protein